MAQINNKKLNIVLMFPGQGSQYINMGMDLLSRNEKYLRYFETAGLIHGENLLDIINNRKEKGVLLDQTQYSQIIIYSLSCALSDYISSRFKFDRSIIKAVIGHSLGDYSALYCCGAYDFENGAKLVSFRGNLMAEYAQGDREDKDLRAGGKYAGRKMMMAAVLGSDIDTISDILKNYTDTVFIANYNDYVQTVLSGYAEEVLKACEEIKARGAKKILTLKVNIASHCPLMKEASQRLGRFIDNEFSGFREPHLKFFSSTTVRNAYCRELRDILADQLISPVRWVDSIEKILRDSAANVFIEIGPGKVLSGLVKRIALKLNYEDIYIFNTDNMTEIENLSDFLGAANSQ